MPGFSYLVNKSSIMKLNFTLILFCLLNIFINPAVSQDLPHQMTMQEILSMPGYVAGKQGPGVPGVLSITPPSSPVRTIGEWEEIQGLLITWTSYTTMLRQIVAA